MNSPFGSSVNNVFAAQVEELFKRKTESESEQILRLVSIILSSGSDSSDLVDLYNAVGIQKFALLIHLFDGQTVKFPTSVDVQETIILAFCYYYKEVKGMTWDEIRETLPFEISASSYGSRIGKLNQFMKNRIREFFEGKTA